MIRANCNTLKKKSSSRKVSNFMYNVTWYVKENEYCKKFKTEAEAREKYDERINSKECDWVELSFILDFYDGFED